MGLIWNFEIKMISSYPAANLGPYERTAYEPSSGMTRSVLYKLYHLCPHQLGPTRSVLYQLLYYQCPDRGMEENFIGDAEMEGFGDEMESLDYENLSNILAEQLQDVDDYFDMLPYLGATSAASEDNLEQLLTVNRKYQQALREQIFLLEEGQKMTKELQRWLKVLQVQMNKRRKLPDGFSLLPPPFFDRRGHAPPENEDFQRCRQMLIEYNKALRHPVKWTEREKTSLVKGVRQQNQLILVDQILEGEQLLGPVGRRITIMYEQAVAVVRAMSPKELEMNLECLDWTKIAASHVPTRSPEECRIQWTTNQHPLISHSEFTKEESKALKKLVEKYGSKGSWVTIAEKLGRHRTVWQCLSQWAQNVNRPESTSTGASGGGVKWALEEDKILLEGIQLFGLDNWSEISEMLEGRSVAQCVHRWSKTLDPGKKMGRWTETEDAWLTAAVKRFGCLNWSTIKEFVPHRNDVQCRERYMNVLNPDLSRDVFSPEEDELLRAAVEKYGKGKWSQVAASLPNRSDNQCRRRWMSILSGKPAKPMAKKKNGRPRRYRQKVGRPLRQESAIGSVAESVIEPVGGTVAESVGGTVAELVGGTVGKSAGKPVGRPVNKSVGEPGTISNTGPSAKPSTGSKTRSNAKSRVRSGTKSKTESGIRSNTRSRARPGAKPNIESIPDQAQSQQPGQNGQQPYHNDQ